MTEVSIYTEHRMAEGESLGKLTWETGDTLIIAVQSFTLYDIIILRGQAGRPRVAGPVQSTGCKSELVDNGPKRGIF